MSEYVEIDAQELNDYISNLEDENEALKAQVEQLREQLEYMAQQHRCGCGHPACNRCYDDKQNAIVLEAKPAQCLAARDAEIIAQAVRDVIAPLSDEDLNLSICNADNGDWNSLVYRDCWAKGFAEGVREREAINQERLVAKRGE